MLRKTKLYSLVVLFSCCTCTLLRSADQLESLAKASKDNKLAAELAKQLQQNPEVELLDVLNAMKGKSAVAQNWYLSVAQTVADRNPEQSRKELEQFLPRLSEDPTARYWAFRFLTRDRRDLREQLLESMLADPSLELRFEAVQQAMDRAKNADWSKDQQKARYRELLAAARLHTQIQEIAKQLDELGLKINLLEHFGFVSQWSVVAPFDNVDQKAFNIAYAPEKAYEDGTLDQSSEYNGKNGPVSWKEVSTEADDGAIDLNPVFEKEKGAVAYGLASFNSPDAIDCQVRIGCPNACKVWVNGDLVISREVYHSGSQMDQYVAPASLKKGENSIFVKICQNEQTQSWAQDWLFQLRFTDSSGLAIQPAQ